MERTQAPPVPEHAPDELIQTAGGVKIKLWALPEKAADKAPDAVENAGKEADPVLPSSEETGSAAMETLEDATENTETVEAEDADTFKELRVYVHSEAKQATEDAILESKCEKYLEALANLHEGLSKPYYLKSYQKVLRKVGRLQEAHKKVAHLFAVTVTQKEGTEYAASVTVTRLDSHEHRVQASGGYVLRTSRKDLSLEELARTYWQLTDIESTFRVMKSELGAPGQLAKCSGCKSRSMKMQPITYFHEPCVYPREGVGEASVVVRMAGAIEHRNDYHLSRRGCLA